VFLDLVGGVDPRRVLLVGVDVAKATWLLVASNLLGGVVVDGVGLAADRAGLAELERLIAATSSRLDAGVVVVGVEAAGHHHQTLVGHLGDREGLVVRLLNPAQVAAVRKQQGNRRRKTDWLDAAAICALLARGEGSPVHLDASPSSALRPLWSGREDLVDARAGPRQQAGALVDCLWSGFSATDNQAGVAPVLSDPFGTRPAEWCWGCWPRLDPGPPGRDRRGRAARGGRGSGWPAVTAGGRPAHRPGRLGAAHPPGRHRRHAGHPGRPARHAGCPGPPDRRAGGRDGPLLAATQGAKLTQLRGVATVAAAGLVAFVGHTGRWSEWSKVWRAAGLDPARRQSGASDHRYGISREGSAWGRRAILDLAASVCRQPGRWQDSHRARTSTGHKHPNVALAAVGNQLGRTLFALMASGADYDPDYQTKRAQRRPANQPKAGGQAA
jgi:transposase